MGGREGAHDVDVLRRFREGAEADPELVADGRMMVPVFFDVERRKWKVWTVLGYRVHELNYSYASPPGVVIQDSPGGISRLFRRRRAHEFGAKTYLSVCPVMRELYVPRVLDRAEVRAICDREHVEAAIVRALSM